MHDFSVVDEREVLRGPVVSVHDATVRDPEGETHDRQIVRHPGAVAVVPLVDDQTALLVRQYRTALDQEVLELPAGKLDVDGEAPERAAARELAEEVGQRASHLERLAVFHTSPGFCDERAIVYLARDLTPCDDDRHGPEERHLQVVRVPLADVRAMIADGDLHDAKTIIGLLLALRGA